MRCKTMKMGRKASLGSFVIHLFLLKLWGEFFAGTPLALGLSWANESSAFGREIPSASALTNPTVRAFMHTGIQTGLQIPYKWIEQVRSCTMVCEGQ